MGNYMIKRQNSAPLALPGDAAVEQSPAGDRCTRRARSAPVARSSPVLTGLRELPRGRETPPADVAPDLLFLLDRLPELMPLIASEFDLDAAKALRLTNKAFREVGASRFTGADVPATEIGNMAQFFSDAANISTLRITDKGNFSDQGLTRLIAMLPDSGAKISRLDLSGCHQITDAGLHNLKGMTAMQSLDLRYCGRVTDTGLGHLSGMTAMKMLNLFGCSKITNTGLGRLSGMTAMQSLDLFGCNRITDAGLGHLKRMTALQTLNLIICTGISETQVRQLRARGIWVHWLG